MYHLPPTHKISDNRKLGMDLFWPLSWKSWNSRVMDLMDLFQMNLHLGSKDINTDATLCLHFSNSKTVAHGIGLFICSASLLSKPSSKAVSQTYKEGCILYFRSVKFTISINNNFWWHLKLNLSELGIIVQC